MAPSFAESMNPHMWSECSRQQLTNFLRFVNNTIIFCPVLFFCINKLIVSYPKVVALEKVH